MLVVTLMIILITATQGGSHRLIRERGGFIFGSAFTWLR